MASSVLASSRDATRRATGSDCDFRRGCLAPERHSVQGRAQALEGRDRRPMLVLAVVLAPFIAADVAVTSIRAAWSGPVRTRWRSPSRSSCASLWQ
jgi:hypothetical protein